MIPHRWVSLLGLLLVGGLAWLFLVNNSPRAETKGACPKGYIPFEEEKMCVPDIGPLPASFPMPASNVNYEIAPIRALTDDGIAMGRIINIEIKRENNIDIPYVRIEDLYGQQLEFLLDTDLEDNKVGDRIVAELKKPTAPYIVKRIAKSSLGAKEDLGRRLFCEPKLSHSKKYPCSSCHNPAQAFADGDNPTSSGDDAMTGSRNTPTLYNMAFNPVFFWDGRAASLEEQIIHPITKRSEMAMTLAVVVEQLKKSTGNYEQEFESVFGTKINFQAVAEAIAAFERTIISTNSSYDKYAMGNKKAMTDSALNGMTLFKGKARCILCHNGPNFTDNQFHNIGYGNDDDPGRYRVTRNEQDKGAFKTPTLRHVAQTPPYMHDGKLGQNRIYDNTSEDTRRANVYKNLQAVVEFFINPPERLGRDPLIKPLTLNDDEKRDLIAFLISLTGDDLGVKCP